MNQPEVGNEIRKLRRARGWTQRVLATTADVNIETVSRIEAGGDTSLSTITRLFAALDANPIAVSPAPVDLSLRDYFAAAALMTQGPLVVYAQQSGEQVLPERLAKACYGMADAMLKTREAK